MNAQQPRLNDRPLGVAVFGLGNWSYQLGRAAQRTPSINLLTCYSRSPEKRERFAATFNCATATTLQELIETPGLEAVIFTTPGYAHAEPAAICARQGLHIFVEKPMAVSLAEAMQLWEICRDAGSTLMVGHEMRRLGSMRAAKKLVEEGALGQVVSAVSAMTLRRRFEIDDWRSDRAKNRGGALVQLGIHPIENLNYLLGNPLRVKGSFANAVAPNGIHDISAAIITYAPDIVATVSASYVSPSSQRLSLYGTEANLHQVVDMRVWPDATLVDDNSELWLEDGKNRQRITFEPRDALAEQLEDFARSIRRGAKPETSGQEGMWAVAVVEGALRSTAEGSAVELRPLFEEIEAKRNLP